MQYKGKDVYKGEWKNDKMHGKGLLTIRDRDNTFAIYEGEFVQDA